MEFSFGSKKEQSVDSEVINNQERATAKLEAMANNDQSMQNQAEQLIYEDYGTQFQAIEVNPSFLLQEENKNFFQPDIHDMNHVGPFGTEL